MTEAEIREHLDRLHGQKSRLQEQISEAKRRAKQEGVYADARWLSGAEGLARQKGRQILWLQGELGRIKKEDRQRRAQENQGMQDERGREFARAFMAEAKQLLPQELYMQLLRLAAEKSGQA